MELRSIRFPFSFLIVVYHYTNYFADYEASSWVLLENLAFVLDGFFILSGVVLAHVYAERERFSYKKYINRRFFRIYPLHILSFASLALVAVLGSLFNFEASNPERYDLSSAWLHITMVHAWFFDPVITFNVPSWSVSAEWFVYLIFPFFLILGRSMKPLYLFLLGCVVASFWYFATLIYTGYSYPVLEGYAIFRAFVDFLLGYGLRLFLSKGSLPFTKFRYASRVYIVLMAASGLCGLPHIISIGVTLWYIAASYERALQQKPDAIFDNLTFNRLGDTAFALYITHMPIAIYATNIIERLTGINLPGPSSDPIVSGIFVFLVALAVSAAWLVHHLIEQPCAIYGPKLLDAISQKLRNAKTPAA